MAAKTQTWTISQNNGLNQRANPTLTGESGIVLQSTNTSWLTDSVLCLRSGWGTQSLTSSGFTGELMWVGRHVTNTGSEELWANANNAGTAVLARRSAGTWSGVTYSDTVTVANLKFHHSATMDGKLYLCYDSDVNRLHMWDGTVLRRVGLIKPSAPTVADGGGAGAYPATPRRYRINYRIYDASNNVIAESELSDAVAFTPSGANANATVTKSATVDSATHWCVWGLISTAGDTYDLYELLAVIVVATTTYADTVQPSAYNGEFPAELGVNIPPPSAKFIISTGTRLVMANGWETSASAGQTTPKPNRVWATRELGTSDRGDDEAIPNSLTRKYFWDIGDAGPITGLLGPIYGDIYVFKQRSIFKLIPTENATSPFRVVGVTETAGALDQRLIAPIGTVGAVFADESRLYRLSATSEPVPFSDPLSVTYTYRVFLTTDLIVYDQREQKILINPKSGFWYDEARGRWGGLLIANAQFINRAVMALDTDGSQRLIMVGKTAAGASLMLATGSVFPKDESTAVVATVVIRRIATPGTQLEFFAPTLYYRAPDASGGLTCTMTYTREDGSTATSGSITLAVAATEGVQMIGGLGLADAQFIDVTITLSQSGGAGDIAAPPTIDVITIPYLEHPIGTV
jgi:hypothetical protein